MQHMRTRPATMPHMKLSELAAVIGADQVSGPQAKISGLTLSSSRVHLGDLFIAAPGQSQHGIRFLGDAISRGAKAVLTDAVGAPQVPEDFPLIEVPNPRAVVARLAAALYDHPSDDFLTIGITGTQGKTTSTHIAEAAFGAQRSAVIGTIGARVGGVEAESALTTPEAPELQALFAVMREEEVEACFMEVSSHALVQGRVDGFTFDVAVFLNLGRDHLDFHRDVDDYFDAKAQLFTPEHARAGVINVDDEYGRRLVELATIPVTTFSSEGNAADWRASVESESESGSTVRVTGPDAENLVFTIPLPGRFNVSNALAMIAALATGGAAPRELVAGLAGLGGVPGRMERIESGRGFGVVVDYAHKPDAIRAVLDALRPVTTGKLIIVVGAGGDRDRGKRPVMGDIAAQIADVVIVTDDNPRTEDPAEIRAAIIAGIQHEAGVHEIAGRQAAIEFALGQAKPGDTVLIAGKGHETGQEIHGVIHPFDDREIVRDILAGDS